MLFLCEATGGIWTWDFNLVGSQYLCRDGPSVCTTQQYCSEAKTKTVMLTASLINWPPNHSQS